LSGEEWEQPRRIKVRQDSLKSPIEAGRQTATHISTAVTHSQAMSTSRFANINTEFGSPNKQPLPPSSQPLFLSVRCLQTHTAACRIRVLVHHHSTTAANSGSGIRARVWIPSTMIITCMESTECFVSYCCHEAAGTFCNERDKFY
jgi:hypothetical protein